MRPKRSYVQSACPLCSLVSGSASVSTTTSLGSLEPSAVPGTAAMSSLHPPAAASASPIPAQGTGAGWYRREEAIMGTSIEVELHATDRNAAEVAIAAVMAEMHRIDATMSPHKATSELSIVNA